MRDRQGLCGRLARAACGMGAAGIPEAVREVARACVIDTLGVTLAGTATPVARRFRAVAGAQFAPGASQVAGSDAGLCAPGAAAANAVAAHALDFDDNCYAGVVHGSAVIVPAALAAAQATGASGAALLDAVVVASEVQYALGAGLTMSLYDRGWWTSCLLGPVGSGVATARLLGLDVARTEAAIALAIGGAGGMKATFGSDAKACLLGLASAGGVTAALMAQAGLSGPVDVVEHPRGLAALFNCGTFEPQALDRLGHDWYLLRPGIDVKRIPVCLSAHAAVDAFETLLRDHAIAPGTIEAVVCDVPELVRANLAHDRPATVQQAQFSLPFALAAAALRGGIGLRELQPDVLADPALHAFMAKVSMHTGPMWDDALRREAPEGAEVTLKLGDGRELRAFQALPRGSASRPLSRDELEGKFLACAAEVMSEEPARHLLSRLHRLESLQTMGLFPDFKTGNS